MYEGPPLHRLAIEDFSVYIIKMKYIDISLRYTIVIYRWFFISCFLKRVGSIPEKEIQASSPPNTGFFAAKFILNPSKRPLWKRKHNFFAEVIRSQNFFPMGKINGKFSNFSGICKKTGPLCVFPVL